MKVDLIVTEFGRPEFLFRLLGQIRFFDFNKVIVHRDACAGITEEIGDYLEIRSNERVGQVVALDKLMAEVTTEYYIGLEEDWMPVGNYMEGILEAIEILKANPMCGSVSLRGNDKKAHNGHSSELVDGVWRMRYNFANFHGFSWAPSVRRLSDYKKIGSYGSHTTFRTKIPWQAEADINKVYKDMGYWFATTEKQYFIHADGGNSTFGK